MALFPCLSKAKREGGCVSKLLHVLKRDEIYKGKLIQLRVDRIVEPSGVTAEREVVHHGGSVVILAHSDDGHIVLVRQYRYAVRQFLWELIAGGVEPGEKPLAAARRELLEESGYRAKKLRLLLDFFASPGFLTEKMFLVEAAGLTRSKAQPDPDERIVVGHFTPAQLMKMIKSRRIRDAKTLVGVFWFLLVNSADC
jgi:ADP-ribose pyrophosphatase